LPLKTGIELYIEKSIKIKIFTFKKKKEEEDVFGQVLVTHICNPSYSGGRDQEGCSSKPAQTGKTLSQKNLHKKRAVGVTQMVEVYLASPGP
jgi:hypothetical protein